jgi:hypothetical protein
MSPTVFTTMAEGHLKDTALVHCSPFALHHWMHYASTMPGYPEWHAGYFVSIAMKYWCSIGRTALKYCTSSTLAGMAASAMTENHKALLDYSTGAMISCTEHCTYVIAYIRVLHKYCADVLVSLAEYCP